ncbi:SMP-30/gluconolactonase/LRE family protein [Urbifossiella limnaea]|uniref:Gluconolactonase n=1 Tax=Urbifossiella limnaea TaxID=2528023 RepID=A0A517XPA9_9BACT|nr:SMP-30/gluconolactonase/LRE family protein [Urbifossiella limnaea]QDU19351.1 Gluconolactonase precursor [Urbifossiella limnaea]
MLRVFAAPAALAAAALVALAPAPSAAQPGEKKATIGSIERKNAKIDELLPKGAVIEVLAGGFKWTEGPVWDKKAKRVLFTDIPNNRVMSWSPADGLKEFLKPSGYTGKEPFTGYEPGANGLAFDKDGALVLCQHGDRRISRLTADGKFQTVADKYNGKRFNSPNDLVYHPNGDLYFTDPPYGLPKQMDDPAKELQFQGVYRLKPNGELTLLTKEMSRPNGIALSPDNKTLYVANSDPARAIWMAFPLGADGAISGAGRVIFDATPEVVAKKPGLPDGMKVDAKGNIFATGPDGVYVFAPDFTYLGKIVIGDKNANCGFGDDGATLYICANDKLVRVRTTTRGLGF